MAPAGPPLGNDQTTVMSAYSEAHPKIEAKPRIAHRSKYRCTGNQQLEMHCTTVLHNLSSCIFPILYIAFWSSSVPLNLRSADGSNSCTIMPVSFEYCAIVAAIFPRSQNWASEWRWSQMIHKWMNCRVDRSGRRGRWRQRELTGVPSRLLLLTRFGGVVTESRAKRTLIMLYLIMNTEDSRCICVRRVPAVSALNVCRASRAAGP